MAYTGTFTKQPAEALNLTVDFATNRLAVGETVVGSPTVVAVDLTDDSVVTSTVIVTGSVSEAAGVVTIPVKAGTDGRSYKITCTVTSDATPAETHEADILMVVTAT